MYIIKNIVQAVSFAIYFIFWPDIIIKYWKLFLKEGDYIIGTGTRILNCYSSDHSYKRNVDSASGGDEYYSGAISSHCKLFDT